MVVERRRKAAFPRFNQYNAAFKYLFEQGFHAEYLLQPEMTRKTLELGTRYSPDYVCAPFKILLGSYIEALEAGADIIVSPGGPCRMGYFGELHFQILHELGYEFDEVNYAAFQDMSQREIFSLIKTFSPGFKLKEMATSVPDTMKIIRYLDEIEAIYHQNCGFEVEKGSFERVYNQFVSSMYTVENGAQIRETYHTAKNAMAALPVNKPLHPLRVGVVGEYFTVMDPFGNLNLEKKLAELGVEVHRHINMSSYNIGFNEANVRAGIRDYVKYDMGPTSSATIRAALEYVKQGFDGVVHVKSSGCTPEIDVVPVLQRISREYKVPFLFLSYDSQTSDTGLDTRLEAFYDMIAMKKRVFT